MPITKIETMDDLLTLVATTKGQGWHFAGNAIRNKDGQCPICAGIVANFSDKLKPNMRWSVEAWSTVNQALYNTQGLPYEVDTLIDEFVQAADMSCPTNDQHTELRTKILVAVGLLFNL